MYFEEFYIKAVWPSLIAYLVVRDNFELQNCNMALQAHPLRRPQRCIPGDHLGDQN
jgi:hypothetical protein